MAAHRHFRCRTRSPENDTFADSPHPGASPVGTSSKPGTSSCSRPGWSSGRATSTVRTFFAELTPARLDLLNTLRGLGPSSVYALAKAAERNYSNVHADIARLTELGLVDRNEDDTVEVKFNAVEIRMALEQAA